MLLKMESWVDSALCFDKYPRPSGYSMHTEKLHTVHSTYRILQK